MTTVLLVDDQRLVRAGLRMLLESTPDLTVVGEAADGVEAVRLAAEHTPDLILMDLRMPGMDGATATAHIMASHPTTKVLVLTTFDDDEHLYPALAAGASGYLVKDTDPDDLLTAIRRTNDGDLLFSPALMRRLVDRALTAAPGPAATAMTTPLTARERDVLALVAEGYGNQEIADRLHLGVTTVKKHIANLMDKTGSDNRVRLAIYAVRTLPPHQ
ncbi:MULTISPECIES: response regulator transcription factor [unclassified Mycolicibacterium]|uniref:response regulator transcription factor n=1 Tax=unclassified Mycolicibacterium TaxID=2636767 RepID=UPI001F4C1629|nr:response regulator transcription factor [Mycolicibacterium sp. YH-1]UNB53818.1 response regulator transcription factor [Mycolicibacterium sp. YH-1]